YVGTTHFLTTTHWARAGEEEASSRERQLTSHFWKPMIQHGSRMARFLDTHESAWDLVNLIVQGEGHAALQIQKELVELGKRIPDTVAGDALRTRLENLVKQRHGMPNDPEIQKLLEEI
ncbi:hypothetical protein BJ138DRAFT_1108128, partial [Hygrophoropsis aurantiaca]